MIFMEHTIRQRSGKSVDARGIFVDIDDTISETSKYIIDTLNYEFGNDEKLPNKKILEEYHFFSKLDCRKIKKIINRIDDIYMNGEFTTNLEPVEDSLEGIVTIDKFIPIIGYMTARPDNFLDDTESWLDRNGFPKLPIIMRPREMLSGDTHVKNRSQWKANLLEKYRNSFGIIDDDENISKFISTDYHGKIFLYNSKNNFAKNKNVVHCYNWKHVEVEIKKMIINN